MTEATAPLTSGAAEHEKGQSARTRAAGSPAQCDGNQKETE